MGFIGTKQEQKEPPLLLESRPQPLFKQNGVKRFEKAKGGSKPYPRGNKTPDFIFCPVCGREPIEIFYRAEGKKRWRIGIRCFYCGGEKTLPFLPHLNIRIKRSRNYQRKIKTVMVEKQREILEATPEERFDQSLSVDDFLESQNDLLGDLLEKPAETPIYYVDGVSSKNEEPRVVVTDFKGDVLIKKDIVKTTANAAKLMAVLEAIVYNGNKACIICTDSRLAVNLANNRWKTQYEHLQNLKNEIIKKKHPHTKVEWIPKWKNFANFIIENEQH